MDFEQLRIGPLSIPLDKCLELLCFRYLTGNPCTEYEGYREYVVAILPQLEVQKENCENIVKQ